MLDCVRGDGLVAGVLGFLLDPLLGEAPCALHADVEDALCVGWGEAELLDLLLLLQVDELCVGGRLVRADGALAALPVKVGVGGLQANNEALSGLVGLLRESLQ